MLALGSLRTRLAVGLCAVGTLAAAVLVASWSAGPASGATTSKPYNAFISPTAASAGTALPFTYKLVNLTNQGLGSANIAIPAGWSVTSVSTPKTFKSNGTDAGYGWTAKVGSGVIELRSPGPTSANKLLTNEYLTVGFQATAPCVNSSTVFQWTPTVKQSNNFSGSGNDFYLANSIPTVTLAPAGAALDHFTIDPISTQTAGTAFDVTVRAVDVCGNPATSYGGGATLSGLAASPAPSSHGADYGALSWSGGVGTGKATAYRAGSGQQITATAVTKSGTSAAFTVSPGPLDSFAFGSIGTQTAGTAFSVDLTAYDLYSNVKTDYSGPATLGGLANSPPLSDTAATYGGSGTNGSSVAFSSGVATTNVTAYLAVAGASLTITDGAVSNASDPFEVLPAGLARFAFVAIGSPQTAGTGFSVTVRAFDTYDNAKTNYSGPATMGGLANSPPLSDTAATYGGSGTNGSSVAFSSGVATTNVTAYLAVAGASLTITDGVSNTSDSFEVLPAAPDHLVFAAQPTNLSAGVAKVGWVKVEVQDAYSNLVSTDNATVVGLSLSTNPTGATLGLPASTSKMVTAGVAQFDDLTVDKVGTGYGLTVAVATSPPTSATSTAFDVTAGPAVALVVDALPDAAPGQPGVQEVAGQAFAVHVTTLDAFGNPNAPVTGATTVALSVQTGTGSLTASPATIDAGGTAGASFSASYSKIENGVVLTAARTAGDALTPDDSDVFDVIEKVVTQTATPNKSTTITTATGQQCNTDSTNTTCVTVILPSGASQVITLSEANCNDSVQFPDGTASAACIGSLLGFFGSLKDASGHNLYGPGGPGQLPPFKIVVEYDKTISGQTGVPTVDVFFSIAPGAPVYVRSEKCTKKGVVNAGANFCTESENRQNDGDTLITVLMWLDLLGKGR